MNTLSDTDEGRARPSVWPVYVAAAVIVAVSLELVLRTPLGPRPQGGLTEAGKLCFLVACTIGVLIAWGLVRLYPWGWWCAAVWTIVFLSVTGFVAFTGDVVDIAHCLFWATIWALLVWPLATRRRLFFPPKQAGEE